MWSVRSDRQPRKISKAGLERLAREIFRQAMFDWGKPDLQADVDAFLQSPWAHELADLFRESPAHALERLKSGAVSPKAFHADYCPSSEVFDSSSKIMNF